MIGTLNERALVLVDSIRGQSGQLRVVEHELANGGHIIDFGVQAKGGLSAGLALARVCVAGLADVALVPGTLGGTAWPHIQVATDQPLKACLLSQYAGWRIQADKFFAMGSGPMRAVAADEDLFSRLSYREGAKVAVGVLESSRLPSESVFELIAEKTKISPDRTVLLTAPTSSAAGNLQVVARSVETALHKLFELGFEMDRIRSAYGTAPLAPVAADDLNGVGRTNDAILYGGTVTLWVDGDDVSLSEIGPRVLSSASPSYGRPFLEVFEQAGRDFYQIDPQLFSPAQIVFQNVETGSVLKFGRLNPEVLQTSFGLH